MALKWFGVKTLFRARAVGRPRLVDKSFDADIDRVEERIVLFRARTFDEAIAKAEREARDYSETIVVNPYGQKVVTEYLGACDAFELFSSPGPTVEVFSTTVLVPTASRKALVDRWFGRPEGRPDQRRRKFLNRDFSGAAR